MHSRFLAVATALVASSCFLSTPSAKADAYNFSISSPAGTSFPLFGSGTLYTSAASGGAQYITAITGTVDNSVNTGDAGDFAITLIPTSAPGTVTRVSYNAQDGSTFFFDYDNTLFPDSASSLDDYGLAFMADGVAYNIGFLGSQALYLGIRPNDIAFDQRTYQGVPISFSVTPAAATVTPEPSSIALLGTGLLGTAGVLRRRFVA